MSGEQIGFNPEAQASALYQAERNGRLYTQGGIYAGFTVITEGKVEWVEVSYNPDTFANQTKQRAHAVAADCNLDILKHTPPGERLMLVLGWESRPDVFEGRPFRPVGVMTVGERVVYCLKGFDYEQYLAEEFERHTAERKRLLFDAAGIRVQWKY